MTLETADVRFVAGGTVQAGGGVYVRRDADKYLYDYCRRGEFAYVLTSRQMGKSSLMIHIKDRLEDEGTLCVILDLTDLGVNVTAEQWYCGFIKVVADQLDLPVEVEAWWERHDHLGLAQRFTSFLEEVLLTNTDRPVVLFVDEIDSTLPLDFTDDFFASIRYLYNARAVNHDLSRLSFVLLGVASPGDLIKDRERTPFNIGKRVELNDFKQEDAVRGLGADQTLVEEVFRYTSGHPYLTLRVFRSLAEKPLETSVEQRVYSLFLGEESTRDHNLQYVRDCLLVSSISMREGESKSDLRRRRRSYEATRERLDKVRQRYHDILRGKRILNRETDPVCIALGLSGVVRVEGGLLQVRNPIYRRVFDEAWIKKNKRIDWAKRATWGTIALFTLILLLAGATLGPRTWKEFIKAKAVAASENLTIRDLNDENAELKQDLLIAQAAKLQQDQESIGLKPDIERAYGNIISLQTKIEEQNQLLAGATANLTKDQTQIATLQSANTNLQLDKNGLNAKIGELTQQLKDAQNKLTATTKPPSPPVPTSTNGTLVVYLANPADTGKKNKDIPGLEVSLDNHYGSYAAVRNGTYLSIPLEEGDHTVMLDTHLAEGFVPVTAPKVHVTRDTKTFLKFVQDPNHVGIYRWTMDGANDADRAKVAPTQIKPN